MYSTTPHSILSIPNTLLNHYGIPPFHETMPDLDRILANNYKNVVLLVMDGLGVNILEQHLPENSFLRKHMVQSLSSVYPCTTTAATTTLNSGRTPLEHGWLGWSCYFKEVDHCVDLFSNQLSGIAQEVPAAQYHLPYQLLPYEHIATRIQRETHGSVETRIVSPFSADYANTCDDVCYHIEEICNQPGRKYIHAYHWQPDACLHQFGTNHIHVKMMISDFNQQLERLAAKLKDTLLIITADHGMTDMMVHFMDDEPYLYECLEQPISMEPRCCSFFVKEDFKTIFPERFLSIYGEHFQLLSHQAFLETGWLGEGTPHPKVDDFIGDYVAVAVSNIGLWCRDNLGYGKKHHAGHAGLRPEEMMVPLIVVETSLTL